MSLQGGGGGGGGGGGDDGGDGGALMMAMRLLQRHGWQPLTFRHSSWPYSLHVMLALRSSSLTRLVTPSPSYTNTGGETERHDLALQRVMT